MDDPRIIGYLFLGGAGAGACQVLAVLSLLCPRDALSCDGARFRPRAEYARLFGAGYIACLLVIFLGIACLVADVGRPDRLLTLAFNPHPTIVGVGAYSLAALLACSAFLGAVWLMCPSIRVGLVRAVSIASFFTGAVTMAYTAILLGLFAGKPLWDSPFVVALFVLSALSTGCATVMVSAFFAKLDAVFSRTMRAVAAFDLAVIALEAVAAACLVATCLGDDAARHGAWSLVAGDWSVPFWLGLVGCGMMIPAAIGLVRFATRSEGASLAASAAVLVGGFCLRACIVGVG